MNAIDKRRVVSNNKERSLPARTHTRDLKQQAKNAGRNLKAGEVDGKPLADKSNTNTSSRDIDISADTPKKMATDCMESQHVLEDGLVDDAKPEQGNGGYSNTSSVVECAEESDAETTCDSVSSQGDSHNADDRAENMARVPKKLSGNRYSNDSSHASGSKSNSKINNSKNKASKNTPKKGAESKKAISTLATKSSSDNSKNMKVHPKPMSDSSEGADGQPLELHEGIGILDETSNDHHSVSTDNGVAKSEEDNGLENQAAIDQKISEMESRIINLESELREVAALEIALYSVVPEHGSSAHKVHTPARRLSRIYIYACKHWSQDKRATVAKNIVSGVVLVSKSCGNDVSRLTFWLSNTIVLREIISQTFGSSCQSSSLVKAYESSGIETKSSLKWKNSSGNGKMNKGLLQFLDDWQETRTFTLALEKVESWIFLRIVESIWWQTLTPNMQSSLPDSATNGNNVKLMGPALGDQGQGVFSIDLWENAFHDALKRLCPVRAGGHECGCLPVLARKVMEQCVSRLDVAMFNAILRESAHEIPTDPLSDPIVDSKVLPIPAGCLSFGSGAQLKNAVGNWARWLSDILGMDTNISTKDETKTFEDSDNSDVKETKIFPLLNALSDLLMLPKDMLVDHAIRMEVCPSISLSLVKRILCNFSPDEFSPDPVPGAVLEALNAECIVERTLSGDDNTFPHSAAPAVYTIPSSSEVAEKVAEAGAAAPQFSRSASVVQRKGYTSDEELDELESCLNSVVELNEKEEGVGNDGGNARYDLLRQVWKAS